MTAHDSAIHPPRLHAWLVALCAAPHEAEGIVGDLAEEFQTTLSNQGIRRARAQYRREAWRTMGDLILSPIAVWEPRSRVAAVASRLVILFVIGSLGHLVLGPMASRMTNAAAGALVTRYEVYSYVPAAEFWDAAWGFSPVIVGGLMAVLALVAGLRPVSAAVSAVALRLVHHGLGVIWIWRHGYPPNMPQFTVAQTFLLAWVWGALIWGSLVFVGAALGRMAWGQGPRAARPASH